MQGNKIDLRDAYKVIRTKLYSSGTKNYYKERARQEGLEHLHEIQRILRYLND